MPVREFNDLNDRGTRRGVEYRDVTRVYSHRLGISRYYCLLFGTNQLWLKVALTKNSDRFGTFLAHLSMNSLDSHPSFFEELLHSFFSGWVYIGYHAKVT